MKCADCKTKLIIKEVWFWDSLNLCEDCFVERAAKEYNKGYDKMIMEQEREKGEQRSKE